MCFFVRVSLLFSRVCLKQDFIKCYKLKKAKETESLALILAYFIY